MAQGAFRLGRDAVTVCHGRRHDGRRLRARVVWRRRDGAAGRRRGGRRAAAVSHARASPRSPSCSAGVPLLAATVQPTATLENLGVYFLEVGAVLYGGGYVLVAFLQGLVDHQGWLTQRQLFDAVAAGQVTPGPVLTTATLSDTSCSVRPAPSSRRWRSSCRPSSSRAARPTDAMAAPLGGCAARRAADLGCLGRDRHRRHAHAGREGLTGPAALIPVLASIVAAVAGAGAAGVLIAGIFASVLVAGLG